MLLIIITCQNITNSINFKMHNYKGQLRREYHDNTPTKSSWEREKDHLQAPKYEPRHDSKYETRQEDRYQDKYEPRHQSRHDSKYEKSQLSYYQSQASRVIYDYDKSEKPSARSQSYSHDQKYLFNEVMQVRIKSFEREEYQQRLRVQISNKMEKGFSVLTINLTDDSNPKFLWNFSIKEGDFMNLKNEQKLKVSYSSFPQMLQNCFRDCQKGEFNEIKNNHLMLEIRKGGEGTLNVLQSNRYKQSVHLWLHFKLANDEQIKEHLSMKLITAQDQINKLRADISNLENTSSQRYHQIQNLSAELNEVKRDNESRCKVIQLNEQQKIQDLQTKLRNESAKAKRQSDLEMKEMRQKLGAQIEVLTKSKNELMNKLTEAKEKIVTLESNQRQQTVRINRLEQDASKYLRQYDTMKAENKQLSDKRFQNEKAITELSCKIDSLKSELQDKKTIINSNVQLKETNNSQISSLEVQCTDQKKQIIKLQTKITELEGQITKINALNSEAMDKISRQKEKLHQRSQILKEQEKELRELKKQQTKLNRENEDLRIRNQDKEAKIKSLNEQLQLTQHKVQQNLTMVAHLQKQLNQRPGMRTTPSYYSNIYQPSAPYTSTTRQLPSQLSTNSNIGTSRVALSTNTLPPKQRSGGDRVADRYQPQIRRYQDRSKSPVPKRLTQQKQPEEEDGYQEKVASYQQPRPVKFKMAKPSQ